MSAGCKVKAVLDGVGGGQAMVLDVPEEVPLELRFNGTAYSTMMVTPDDLDDFVTGFSLTEAIVENGEAIKGLTVVSQEGGLVADVHLHGADYAALLRGGERAIPGRTGCGICGVRTLDEARRALDPAPSGPEIDFGAIQAALEALDDPKSGNAARRGVHAAAFCSADGTISHIREDVGRHNALDKLIGALVRTPKRVDVADGFCLVTSRCSYEMVQKAVRAGFSTLVAISAPTALALRVAEEAGLTVIALARKDGCFRFETRQALAQEIAV
ncbi:MAG: formate dehydrogenase accessory sulfurtransferase FdhD [Hyphomicrobiales bacterium]